MSKKRKMASNFYEKVPLTLLDSLRAHGISKRKAKSFLKTLNPPTILEASRKD